MKKCSFCGEEISDAATVCQWCGRKQQNTGAKAPSTRPPKRMHYVTRGILYFVSCLAVAGIAVVLIRLDLGAELDQFFALGGLLTSLYLLSKSFRLIVLRDEDEGHIGYGAHAVITCPYCGGTKRIQKEVHGELTCGFCGKTYHVDIDTK